MGQVGRLSAVADRTGERLQANLGSAITRQYNPGWQVSTGQPGSTRVTVKLNLSEVRGERDSLTEE